MCTLSFARRDFLKVGKHRRVHRLHGAAGLVAIFDGAFVLPLGLAGDAARKAERLTLGWNGLEAAEAEIGHTSY